jgi:acyl carrier protein
MIYRDAGLLDFFEEQYRRARGSQRDIRLSDRLYDDLGVDSLLANELMVALEDRCDLRLLHDPRVWQVTTVSELLEVVREIGLEQQPSSAEPAA